MLVMARRRHLGSVAAPVIEVFLTVDSNRKRSAVPTVDNRCMRLAWSEAVRTSIGAPFCGAAITTDRKIFPTLLG